MLSCRLIGHSLGAQYILFPDYQMTIKQTQIDYLKTVIDPGSLSELTLTLGGPSGGRWKNYKGTQGRWMECYLFDVGGAEEKINISHSDFSGIRLHGNLKIRKVKRIQTTMTVYLDTNV